MSIESLFWFIDTSKLYDSQVKKTIIKIILAIKGEFFLLQLISN